MGLDITHDAWHGAYSSFHRWRKEIAKAAGLPPLDLMEGFYQEGGHGNPFILLDFKYPKGDELEIFQITEIRKSLPIKWDSLKPNPLYELLHHSDCDGYINWSKCKAIADKLSELIEKLPNDDLGGHIGDIRQKTQTFIDGLNLAYHKKEKLEFR